MCLFSEKSSVSKLYTFELSSINCLKEKGVSSYLTKRKLKILIFQRVSLRSTRIHSQIGKFSYSLLSLAISNTSPWYPPYNHHGVDLLMR